MEQRNFALNTICLKNVPDVRFRVVELSDIFKLIFPYVNFWVFDRVGGTGVKLVVHSLKILGNVFCIFCLKVCSSKFEYKLEYFLRTLVSRSKSHIEAYKKRLKFCRGELGRETHATRPIFPNLNKKFELERIKFAASRPMFCLKNIFIGRA